MAQPAKVIVYSKQDEEGVAYIIQARPGAPVFTIGRQGADLVIPEAHISARQAVMIPPSNEKPFWRILDTSTNGTSLDGTPMGKNNEVELRGGEKINFSIRPFPFAVFQLPSATDPPSSGKRRRANPAHGMVDVTPASVASTAAGEDVAAAKATLEKQVGVQAKDLQRLREELADAQRAASEANAKAATSEAALQEQASEHAAALSTKDEELAQQSRAAQHELRVLTREHEAALKAEVGKRHELEQTIATSDEATAHAHASLTSAKEELSVLRQRVEASEARATEKAELLAVAEADKAELQRKLTLAEEREQAAVREAQSAQASSEAAVRSARDQEENGAQLRKTLEQLRREAAEARKEELSKSTELQTNLDRALDTNQRLAEETQKHEELKERVEADSRRHADEKARLVAELREMQTAQTKLLGERNDANAEAAEHQRRYSTLLSDAQMTLGSLAKLAESAQTLSAEAQRARIDAHHKLQTDGLNTLGMSQSSSQRAGGHGNDEFLVGGGSAPQPADDDERISMTQMDVGSAVRAVGGMATMRPASSPHGSSQQSVGSAGRRSNSSAGGPTQGRATDPLRPHALFAGGDGAMGAGLSTPLAAVPEAHPLGMHPLGMTSSPTGEGDSATPAGLPAAGLAATSSLAASGLAYAGATESLGGGGATQMDATVLVHEPAFVEQADAAASTDVSQQPGDPGEPSEGFGHDVSHSRSAGVSRAGSGPGTQEDGGGPILRLEPGVMTLGRLAGVPEEQGMDAALNAETEDDDGANETEGDDEQQPAEAPQFGATGDHFQAGATDGGAGATEGGGALYTGGVEAYDAEVHTPDQGPPPADEPMADAFGETCAYDDEPDGGKENGGNVGMDEETCEHD